MTTLNNVLQFMMDALAEQGVAVDPNTAETVKRKIQEKFSGESLYIQRKPKLTKTTGVDKVPGKSKKEQAAALGISTRHLSRLRSGK